MFFFIVYIFISVTAENGTRSKLNSQGQPGDPNQQKDDDQIAINNQRIYICRRESVV